jgi:hypothetical protein
LLERPVDVVAEPLRVDRRRVRERREDGILGHEALAADWDQLADGDAVARHDKAVTRIQRAHHLTAVVTKLPLRDGFLHTHSVARVRRRVEPEFSDWPSLALGGVSLNVGSFALHCWCLRDRDG